MTPQTAVTLIGMPSTGKSTYLAALYQTMAVPHSASQARLARQPSQRVYLEELRQAWLRGEPVGRTLPDSGELVELDVLFPEQDEVRLAVPDIAGETFEDLSVRRQADAAVTKLVQDAKGVLLFTHPDHQRPRVPIASLKRMQALVGDRDPLDVDKTRDEENVFDVRAVPGEVQLIDLLQWATRVREHRAAAAPHRIALMISAWDRAGDRSPADWLSAKMPMLQSFLEAQQERVAWRIYGVCAQGGDYETEPVAERRPQGRAYVLLSDGLRGNDLTAPLRWAALG